MVISLADIIEQAGGLLDKPFNYISDPNESSDR
jgi:hypothetical protein